MNNFFDGGHIGFAIGALLYGLFILALVAVALVLAFLLARFLLVATQAAKIYVAKNGTTTTTLAAPVTEPATPAAEAPSSVVPPAVSTTKPVAKPRTPKTPPVE